MSIDRRRDAGGSDFGKKSARRQGSGRNGQDEKHKTIVGSLRKALKGLSGALPILLGVILLLGLFRAFVSKQWISSVFTGHLLRDTLTAGAIGSISAGNPITSYIIGGELLKDGVSLLAVTSFIVTWVTVGIVQLPAEAAILGRRFATVRNILSFVLAILVSVATVTTVSIMQ
jgi:uncharacterized membrane protein YraQ (UPF0718 family)